jgi:hypothetical protein
MLLNINKRQHLGTFAIQVYTPSGVCIFNFVTFLSVTKTYWSAELCKVVH